MSRRVAGYNLGHSFPISFGAKGVLTLIPLAIPHNLTRPSRLCNYSSPLEVSICAENATASTEWTRVASIRGYPLGAAVDTGDAIREWQISGFANVLTTNSQE
jgi:hypothetical protein